MPRVLGMLVVLLCGFGSGINWPAVSGVVANSCYAEELQYQGESGPAAGKRIVLLAGDHEYRSEETLPALARILARHYGAVCTVLFSTDPQSGEILPGSSHMTGLEALAEADLMVIFLRFQDFPEEQMRHIDAYLQRGGPVVGLRTSTHAFNIPPSGPYAHFSFRHEGESMPGGFGRTILGETWAGHYGKNHVMSTRHDLIPEQRAHPILKGVEQPWVRSGGYWTEPRAGCEVLAMAQPLQGMTPDAPPAADKDPCPAAWTTSYQSASGESARVFTSTYGASQDLLDRDYRRMLVNACLWGMGLEEKITPDSQIDFVGPFHPTPFRFEGYRRGVKPLDMEGWESPIMDPSLPTSAPKASEKP